MSTFMANAQTIERKWYILDAAGKPMGRTAAKAAAILRGKHKVDFTPHADCGDFVIISDAPGRQRYDAQEFRGPLVPGPPEGLCGQRAQTSGAKARCAGR